MAQLVKLLRWLAGGLLDVLYPPACPERPPSLSAPVPPGVVGSVKRDDDLSLGLLFRKPSLWNRRFWRVRSAAPVSHEGKSVASRTSGKRRGSDELDRR